MSAEFYWAAVALVTIVSSARITRLLTYDQFPPILAARDWFADKTDGSGWQLIAYCAYCMSFWVTIGIVLSGWFSGFHLIWWLVNSIFAGSYLAAVFMVHDGETD